MELCLYHVDYYVLSHTFTCICLIINNNVDIIIIISSGS